MNSNPNNPGQADAVPASKAPLEEQPPVPTKPLILLKASRDKLELAIQFQKTGSNTANPLMEDIQAELDKLGATYGLNEVILRQLCLNPNYDRPLVIARGRPPKTGRDGYLKFLVETTRDMRPKIREDGTADYKNLGLVQNVFKDQPLCEVHPPEKGADGKDIFGNVIDGIYGKEAKAPVGSGTRLDKERGLVLAEHDGDVHLRQGVLNVADVLRISGNVDNATGDIHFVGDIQIGGFVVSGFKVTSAGNVTVRGVVEGATIEAVGDIIVNEGVNGMGRGSLSAGGDIKCRFIQSCSLRAEGNIYADTIMYCALECGGNVELTGKRATLIGGRSHIAGKLSARTIGTESHVATEIVMCATGTAKNQEAAALAEKVKEIDGEITKLVQLLTRFDDLHKLGRLTPEQAETVEKIRQSYLVTSQSRKDTQARLEQVKREQLEAAQKNSFIECKGPIHTGVRISFGPLIFPVSESFVNSRVYVTKDGIKTSVL